MAQAAVGCSLQNPESDIRRFFPAMTDYSIHYLTFANQNPEAHAQLSRRLDGELDPVYELPDTPYTLYIVNGGSERLGYVFGTNQRGRYSNIQVIAIVDARIELQRIYIQRIRSPAYEAFQSEAFGEALARLPLERFPDLRSCYREGDCTELPFSDPSGGEQAEDYRSIIRGIAKLHLLSELLLRPGDSPIPANVRARAEWIGNIGGSTLSRRVLRDPGFQTLGSFEVAPDEPVVLWSHATGDRIIPVSILRATPIVELELNALPYRIIWSETSGSAVAFQTQRHLEMTDDVLFGVRLLRDVESTARFHPILGTTVYGEPEFDLSRQPGIRLLSYEEARRHSPHARIIEAHDPPIPISSEVRAPGPLVWVVDDESGIRAWRPTTLGGVGIESDDDAIQFWMTEDGYRSTFPDGELN